MAYPAKGLISYKKPEESKVVQQLHGTVCAALLCVPHVQLLLLRGFWPQGKKGLAAIELVWTQCSPLAQALQLDRWWLWLAKPRSWASPMGGDWFSIKQMERLGAGIERVDQITQSGCNNISHPTCSSCQYQSKVKASNQVGLKETQRQYCQDGKRVKQSIYKANAGISLLPTLHASCPTRWNCSYVWP